MAALLLAGPGLGLPLPAAAQIPPEWLSPYPTLAPAHADAVRPAPPRRAPSRPPTAGPFAAVPGAGAGSTGFHSAAGPPIAGDDAAPVPPRQPPRPRKEARDPYEPLGLRLGSFRLKPAIEVGGGYDTNPARDAVPRGGPVLIVAPELQLASDWARHDVRADVRGRYTAYPGFASVPSLDRSAAEAKINGRIDLTRQTRVNLEGRFTLAHEHPGSPNLPAGIAELPRVLSHGVTVGLAHRFNRFELAASGSLDRTSYGDSPLTDGTIVSNRDRDFDQYGARLRGSYELVPGVRPFVEVGLDRRVHALAIDRFGFQRDSRGQQVLAGSTFELTQLLTGSAAIGYAARHYRDPALASPAGPIVDAMLAWSATPLTTATVRARTQVEDSILPGVAGVLRRDLGLEIEHAFRRWLLATVRFDYGRDLFVGSTREDHRFVLSGLLTYKLSREVQLKAEARREWRHSNAAADYAANILLFGLRLQR